ncbi:unnamed protein product [Malus baccata var. baccata]
MTSFCHLHILSNPHKSPSQFLSSHLFSGGRDFSTNTFGFGPSPSSSTKRLPLKCHQSEYFDQQRTSTTTSPNKPSPASIYVGHSIYKGKTDLTIEPKAPEFTPLDSGFTPTAGTRVYDWSRPVLQNYSTTCRYYHQPVRSVLQIIHEHYLYSIDRRLGGLHYVPYIGPQLGLMKNTWRTYSIRNTIQPEQFHSFIYSQKSVTCHMSW